MTITEDKALYERTLSAIEPMDVQWLDRASSYQCRLTKPPGSLGVLETVAARLCGIQQTLPPIIDRTKVIVFAADHGLTRHHVVGPYPREVTAQMVANFAAGGAAINAFARLNDASFAVVNMGVDAELSQFGLSESENLIEAPVAAGTQDITSGPAMSEAELYQALSTGIRLADECADAGYQAVAVGEMGIGNTTVAGAVTSALLHMAPADVTGRGTGADDDTLRRKITLIEQAMDVNKASLDSGFSVLRSLGGFELAGIAGLTLGLARRRIAVVADGYISTAAVFAATTLTSGVSDYVFCGHRSTEPGHQALLDAMNQKPLLDLGLRLGEGTGACLSLSLLKAAARAMSDMATFDEAGVEDKA